MARKLNKNVAPPKDENSMQWNPHDEQLLRFSVQSQIAATESDIRNARSPQKKSQLKEELRRLKALQKKITSGNYGSTELYEKLARSGIAVEAAERGSGSVSRYDTMDFKFDAYFRQTRYYGAVLPILLIIFTAILLAVLVVGSFLPATVNKVFDGIGLPIDAMYTFKLSAEEDFIIVNDGKWPNGIWVDDKKLADGVKYVSPTGDTPSTVRVYADLGIRAIKLSFFDVSNAFFRTKIMAKYKIAAIEDLSVFDGADWFYAKYMLNQEEWLTFGKQADGTYNTSALIYILALYGTIISVLGIVVMALCCILSSIVSMFTYTGRRIHFYALFLLLFTVLALFLPCFLAISSGVASSNCISQYLTVTDKAFLASDVAQIKFNLPLLIAIIPAVFVLILPKLFKNRPSKLPTYVPKGNRAPSQALLAAAATPVARQPQRPNPAPRPMAAPVGMPSSVMLTAPSLGTPSAGGRPIVVGRHRQGPDSAHNPNRKPNSKR